MESQRSGLPKGGETSRNPFSSISLVEPTMTSTQEIESGGEARVTNCHALDAARSNQLFMKLRLGQRSQMEGVLIYPGSGCNMIPLS